MTFSFLLAVITVVLGLYLLGRMAWWAIDYLVALRTMRALASFSAELALLRLHKRLCDTTHHMEKKEPGDSPAHKSPSVN